MALLLHIETAVSGASICFSEDEKILHHSGSDEPRETAAWLQVAIADAAAASGLSLKELDAVSVSAGPGSYTGLRVGMASAKGLCYALQKPLITVLTLQIMCAAALASAPSNVPAGEPLRLCPMIDARRMEVFTALYDRHLGELLPAHSLVLDETSFSAELAAGPVLFFGNGSPKWQALLQHPNAFFTEAEPSARFMTSLATKAFHNQLFADLAYCEPLYAKEFYTPVPPKKA